MLTHNILRGMRQTDLNQRYQETYLQYNGKIVYCVGFTDNQGHRNDLPAGAPLFHIQRASLNGRVELVPFDWQLVNVERPITGWYDINLMNDRYEFVTKGIAYLGLNNTRQWQRGLNHRTTFTKIPASGGWIVDRFALYDEAYKSSKTFKLKKSLREILESVLTKNGIILQSNLAIVKGAPVNSKAIANVYWRSKEIGYLSDKEIVLTKGQFKDEVLESVVDARITIRETPEVEYKASEEKPKSKYNSFGTWTSARGGPEDTFYADEVIIDGTPPEQPPVVAIQPQLVQRAGLYAADIQGVRLVNNNRMAPGTPEDPFGVRRLNIQDAAFFHEVERVKPAHRRNVAFGQALARRYQEAHALGQYIVYREPNEN